MYSRWARHLPSQAHVLVRRFCKDTEGSVIIIFALMIVSLFLFIGAAVDIGRWAHARHQTIQAMDAAVLAGASVMQAAENPASMLAAAQETAMRYYQENTQNRAEVIDDTIGFTAINDNTSFVATGNAFIRTAFLNFAHIPKLPLLDTTKATFSQAELNGGGQGGGGGNAKIDVEISMMLDVTGSMKGSKIVDLRAAAKDLVNIVITEGPYARKVRVALVPFADAVRLPATSVGDAVGTPDKIVKKTSGNGNNQKTYLYNRSETCVVERIGNDRYTDTAPGTNTYVTPFRGQVATVSASQGTVLIDNKSNATQGANATIQWKSNSNLSQSEKTKLVNAANSSASCALSTDEELVPLSADKTYLNGRIDKLDVSSSTAGHIGTAWAWYTLSPNWNRLWSSANQAAAYGEKTQKIAILMTDGEYNLQYDANGIGTSQSGSGSAANGTSANQAKALCTAMKAKGITIYTVGFALGGNQSAIQTLSHCATDSSTNYTADNGTELRQSFRDIARKIAPLYLSH